MSTFLAPPRERLYVELERFLSWFTDPPPGLDGLVRAGLTHLWFLTLHPFEDGNGRIGRALTEMVLAQDEHQPRRFYSLSVRIEKERAAYYDILEKTHRGNLDLTPWLVLFLEQIASRPLLGRLPQAHATLEVGRGAGQFSPHRRAAR